MRIDLLRFMLEHGPFAELMELKLVRVEEGRSQCQINIDDKHLNIWRTVHGGAISSLIDVAMGAAVGSVMGDDELCLTIEMKINFLSGPQTGPLDCTAKLLHKVDHIAVVESETVNDGRLIAKAMGTYYVGNQPSEGLLEMLAKKVN